jgi:fatty acyl-CoA reductase
MYIVQTKLAKAVQCLEYFTNSQWRFKTDNAKELLGQMSQEDRDTFQFDVTSIDWPDYIEKYVMGFREYLFKQNPETLPQSRKVMTR